MHPLGLESWTLEFGLGVSSRVGVYCHKSKSRKWKKQHKVEILVGCMMSAAEMVWMLSNLGQATVLLRKSFSMHIDGHQEKRVD